MKRWNTPSGSSPFDGTSLATIAEGPHWVYEIYGPNGTCWYVGMTCDIKRRTREHRRRFGPGVTVRSTQVAIDWRRTTSRRI